MNLKLYLARLKALFAISRRSSEKSISELVCREKVGDKQTLVSTAYRLSVHYDLNVWDDESPSSGKGVRHGR